MPDASLLLGRVRRRELRRAFPSLLLVMLAQAMAVSQPLYVHYQTSVARSVAMAGAFTSVQDYHNSLSWNPASLVLAKDRSPLRERTLLGVNVDVLSVVVGVIGGALEGVTSEEDESVDWRVLGLLLYSIRGCTILNEDNILLSVNLHEDLLDFPRTFENIFDNASQTATLSYVIGREFAVGASLSYLQVNAQGARRRGFGGMFGLQYNALSVPGLYYGLTFVRLENAVADARSRVEHVFDNALNLGVSYELGDGYLVSADVRNLASTREAYFCEIHAGFEQSFLHLLSLREGLFFVNNNLRKPTVSFGLGYRSPLFSERREPNLDLGLAFVVNNNTPPTRYDLLITLRFGTPW